MCPVPIISHQTRFLIFYTPGRCICTFAHLHIGTLTLVPSSTTATVSTTAAPAVATAPAVIPAVVPAVESTLPVAEFFTTTGNYVRIQVTLTQYLSFTDPYLDTDLTVNGQCEHMGVINVHTKGMQRGTEEARHSSLFELSRWAARSGFSSRSPIFTSV